MAGSFKRATRKQLKLRMAICGPAKAGKTKTSLRFAFTLAQHMCEQEAANAVRPRRFVDAKSPQQPPAPRAPRVAVIDSENRSAAKYQGETWDDNLFDFDVIELNGDFSPSTYQSLIEEAANLRYDVVVVDSLSHAWLGTLDLVDKKTKKNAFTEGWREVSPMHNQLIDAIVRCPIHVICTMRSKVEYVMEINERGQSIPRKKGMAPVQRAGVEYEFDIVADVDQDHILKVDGSRCGAIDGKCATKPGAAYMQPIIHWLERGSVPEDVIAAAGMMDVEQFRPAGIAGGNGTANDAPSVDPKELARQAAEKRRAKTATPAAAAPEAPDNVVADSDSSSDSTADPSADPAPDPDSAPASDAIIDTTRNEILSIAKANSIPPDVIISACQRRGGARLAELTEVAGQDLLRSVKSMVARDQAENARREELGFVGDAAPPASESPPFI